MAALSPTGQAATTALMANQTPWAGSNRAAHLPKNWPTIRKAILRRDPTCALRTHCHGNLSAEVDHIGDRDDHRPHMLRGACKACHAARTQCQAMQSRGAGPLRRRPTEPHPGLTG